MRPGIDTAALSLPRGNGKSWLSAVIAARAMKTIEDYQEVALFAASIEQARIVFKFTRRMLGERGYRYLDSSTRCAITRQDGARLRVVGSNAKTSFGLVDTPLVVADEPGAWERRGGQMLFDAITTSMGKPGSPLKAVFIGTLAPAESGWWHDLIDAGSGGSVYVQALRGNPERWDKWPEIRRCNPLSNIDATFRRKLLEERDAARADSRLKARFLSYRLNVPTADESELLLTVEDYRRALARDVAAAAGRPIVAMDLGGGRAWSAAVATWRSGRIEALAVCPGIPGIAAQEKRDRVGAGTYQRLVDAGVLHVATGRRVQPPGALWEQVVGRWGVPASVVCDRFRLSDLQDAVRGRVEIEPRVSRWSEAAEDIRALRRYVKDGPFSIDPDSRLLLAASLAVARVKNDDQGNTRLSKRGTDNAARDDVAAALTLAAGAYQRAERLASARSETVGYAVV